MDSPLLDVKHFFYRVSPLEVVRLDLIGKVKVERVPEQRTENMHQKHETAEYWCLTFYDCNNEVLAESLPMGEAGAGVALGEYMIAVRACNRNMPNVLVTS